MSANMRLNRWGNRVTLHSAAELRTDQESTAQVVIRDVSLSGAYLNTLLRLPLNSQVRVRLASSGEWWAGTVTRRDDTGLALEWVDPGLHVMASLMESHRAIKQVPQQSLRRMSRQRQTSLR